MKLVKVACRGFPSRHFFGLPRSGSVQHVQASAAFSFSDCSGHDQLGFCTPCQRLVASKFGIALTKVETNSKVALLSWFKVATNMDDDTLRAELIRLGYTQVGPITSQTRSIYERKLRELTGNRASATGAQSSGASSVRKKSANGTGSKKTNVVEKVAAVSSHEKSATNREDKRADQPNGNGPAVSDMDVDAPATTGQEASTQQAVLELQAELARLQHRCATAERRVEQLEQERGRPGLSGHCEELCGDLLKTLDEPTRCSDVSFITSEGDSLLACRSLLAMRCPEMVGDLFVQDDFVIVAQTLTRHQYEVGVRRVYSVRAVKELIAARQGTPVNEQRLVYQNEELDDCRCLADYGINQACVVHLVIRDSARENGVVTDDCAHADRSPSRVYGAPIACVLDMPDITKPALLSFMAFLYSGRVELNADVVCGVYVLSRRYKILSLCRETVTCIQRNLDLSNVWELLELADKQCSMELKKVSLDFIAQQNALQQLHHYLPNLAESLLQFWQLHCQ